MNKFHLLVVGLFLLGLSSNSTSAPIVITQIYHDTNLVVPVNGIDQVVTGDWIFKGITDTAETDLSPLISVGSYSATVTLTQASLDLVDVLVTNLDYLYVYSDRVGFSSQIGNSPAPWTRTAGSFSNPNLFPTIPELTITQNTTFLNTLGQQNTGFLLGDGTVIEGYFTDLSSSMNAQIIPIPPAFFLFGSGLLGLIGISRRKKVA